MAKSKRQFGDKTEFNNSLHFIIQHGCQFPSNLISNSLYEIPLILLKHLLAVPPVANTQATSVQSTVALVIRRLLWSSTSILTEFNIGTCISLDLVGGTVQSWL